MKLTPSNNRRSLLMAGLSALLPAAGRADTGAEAAEVLDAVEVAQQLRVLTAACLAGDVQAILAFGKAVPEAPRARVLAEMDGGVITQFDRPDVLQALLAAGLWAERPDKHGRTLLHRAVAASQVGQVRVLLQAGCAVDARDHYQATPLMLARSAPVADELLAKGASLLAHDNSGMHPLLRLTSVGCSDVAHLLIKRYAPVNLADRFGDTALMLAAANGDVTLMRALLDMGADPHRRNGNGWNALFWTGAGIGDKPVAPCVELLLKHGVKSRIPDLYRDTPLTVMRRSFRPDMVRFQVDPALRQLRMEDLRRAIQLLERAKG